ncbi:hypothetical protein GO986_09050 [Deinococcus sp. HMF7620]|uniref:Copper amine oxidase-like N-terminal domain-containing protein n=1 Tax=Deinococcus arboris TaxID=2682977 RepID=A0A7C9I2X9_9DEIO|nr:stalk domain-containing protein [Deinococcus arboris]MVN86911.1 hypothetical protein [Deinococcus arboris]
MRSLGALLVATLCSAAAAATTYTQNGVEYVNLQEFAQENGITSRNQGGDLTLTKGNITLFLPVGMPEAATRNGQPAPLSARVTNIGGAIVVPLMDVQRAFGLKVTASLSKAPVPVASGATKPSTPLVLMPAPKPAPTTSAPPPTTPTIALNAELRTKIGATKPIEVVYEKKPFPGYDFTYGSKTSLPLTLKPEDFAAHCANLVFARLKSPATANFGAVRVYAYPNNYWVTVGLVDAQNSYGALIRDEYRCVNAYVNGVVWHSWDFVK